MSTCCEAWDKAHTEGTDNEGYLSLIYTASRLATEELGVPAGAALIGSWGELPSIKFCPWCGTKKET